MMLEPTPSATMSNSVTTAKCPAVSAVRISFATLVSMMGSERRPGLATCGVQVITITISSFPSSGIRVQ